MEEIGKMAKAVGARVLVDEVYLDAVFESAPRSAFHFGNEFVTTNSLTKVYGLSGLRCGWVLGEPALIEKMWRLSDLFNGIPTHAGELLGILALERLPQLKARTRAILDHNRSLVKTPSSASRPEPRMPAGKIRHDAIPEAQGHCRRDPVRYPASQV